MTPYKHIVDYHIGVDSGVVCSTELGNFQSLRTWNGQQDDSTLFLCLNLMVVIVCPPLDMDSSNDVIFANAPKTIGETSNTSTFLLSSEGTQDPLSAMSDQEIVTAILERNKNVTSLFLYKKCYPLFYAIYRNYYTDCESCIEFINDIYLYIMTPSRATGLNKLQGFRHECSLLLWLKEVCIYYCYARYRRKSREETLLQTYADRLKAETQSIDIDFSKIEKEDILKLISYMSNSRYADIIRLYYVENKTNDEVAEILGMSKANLYNKHILAKNMFAKILRKEVRYV